MYIPTSVLTQGSTALAVLFDQTLAVDTAIIDTGANGISQNYTSLVVRMLLRNDQAVDISTVIVRVNGNSGTNYDSQLIQGVNATPAASIQLAGTSWSAACVGANGLASQATVVEVSIPFYTATNFLKSGVLMSATATDTATEMWMQLYAVNFRSTAAITRMSVAPGGGTVLVAGSRMQILGSV